MTVQFDFRLNRGNLWEGGIPYVPAVDVCAGKLVETGHLRAFTKLDIAANDRGNMHQEGLWEGLKKTSVDTFAIGDLIYWDYTNEYCSATPSPLLLGICVWAAAATDEFVVFKFVDFPMAVPILATAEETILRTGMTDNGDATGYIDLTEQPAGRLVLGHEVKIVTGFAGDTTAVYQLGVAGDLDQFSIITTGSVLAAGNVGCQPSASGYLAAATTPRLTITGGSDFGDITAGKAQVTFFYIPLSSKPLLA